MKKNKSKSIYYNLLVKNLIISSVLFSLVFFDMKLQDFKIGGNPRQVELIGALNVKEDQRTDEFSVELIHMNKVIHTINVGPAQTFNFQLAANSIYQLRISRENKSCNEVTIFTRQPEQASTKEIRAIIDLTRSRPAEANLPPDLIAWDYDLRGYGYIEDNTLQSRDLLYSENTY